MAPECDFRPVNGEGLCFSAMDADPILDLVWLDAVGTLGAAGALSGE